MTGSRAARAAARTSRRARDGRSTRRDAGEPGKPSLRAATIATPRSRARIDAMHAEAEGAAPANGGAEVPAATFNARRRERRSRRLPAFSGAPMSASRTATCRSSTPAAAINSARTREPRITPSSTGTRAQHTGTPPAHSSALTALSALRVSAIGSRTSTLIQSPRSSAPAPSDDGQSGS